MNYEKGMKLYFVDKDGNIREGKLIAYFDMIHKFEVNDSHGNSYIVDEVELSNDESKLNVLRLHFLDKIRNPKHVPMAPNGVRMCPSCNEILNRELIGTTGYCPNCGQKIIFSNDIAD